MSTTYHLPPNRVSITDSEAAALAHYCVAVFQRKCREGNGPKSNGRTRKARRFWLSDVLDWIDRGFKNDEDPSS